MVHFPANEWPRVPETVDSWFKKKKLVSVYLTTKYHSPEDESLKTVIPISFMCFWPCILVIFDFMFQLNALSLVYYISFVFLYMFRAILCSFQEDLLYIYSIWFFMCHSVNNWMIKLKYRISLKLCKLSLKYEGNSISKIQIAIEKNRMEIMTYKQHLFFNIISIQI